MYKIAVIGNKDSVLGFKAVGLDVFFTDHLVLSDLIDDLAKKQYAIIYVTEEVFEKIHDSINDYHDEIIPAIIPIPSNKGSKGIGMKNIKDAAEKAIGADILFKDN
ncbi:MAG: V-type ATP synthase subunit F [Clostridiales bacterium]|nr:V-type ATP synthase subunit F [Clostridiales bacterium]